VRNRRRQSRGRWTGGRVARLLISLLVAGFVGWWAVKVAAVGALARSNPPAAFGIAPDHPTAATEMALLEIAVRNGRIAPADRDRALHALDRAALADEPFLVAGLAAAADGQAARSEALLAEARRRNPRERMARLLLLNRYLSTGRSPEAGTELAVILRLVPDASAALVPQMAQLASDPKTGQGLAALLGRNPQLRDTVLTRLAAAGADPDLVLTLAARSGSGRNPAAPPDWQHFLLDGLIAKGQVARARQVWLASLAGRGAPPAVGVYDGAFRGAPGAAPFNWDLVSNGEGAAERVSPPALQVSYYGRNNAMLARQLLLLGPGGYRLQFRADGAAKGEGSRLQWTLACTGAPAPLVQVPLKDIVSAPRTIVATFEVPASGCAAQWLRLEGVAGDVAAEQDVHVTDLQVVPAKGKGK
jgi:hypothetical protein